MITEGTSDILFHMTDKESASKILKSGNFILMPSFDVGGEQDYQEGNKVFYMSMARSKTSSYFEVFPESPVLFVMDGRKLKQNYRIKPIDFFSDLSDGVYAGQPSERSTGYSEMEDRLISSDNLLNVKKYVTSIHTIIPSKATSSIFHSFLIWKYGKKLGIPVYFYENYKKLIMGKNPSNYDYKLYSKQLKNKTGHFVDKIIHRQLKPHRELILAKKYDNLSIEAKHLLQAFYKNPSESKSDMTNFIKRAIKSNPSEVRKFINLLKQNKFNTYDDYIDFVILRFEDNLN
jgi:hypothetical protein